PSRQSGPPSRDDRPVRSVRKKRPPGDSRPQSDPLRWGLLPESGRILVRSDAVEGRVGATRSEFLPFYAPSIGDEEIREVTAALRSGWLTTGPRVQQFEEEFAGVVGAPAAAAVSSCTAALHVS